MKTTTINTEFSEWSFPEPRNGNRLTDYIISNQGLNWTSNDTSVTESELFEKATYELDELVKRFYVRFFKANPVSYLNFYFIFILIHIMAKFTCLTYGSISTLLMTHQ